MKKLVNTTFVNSWFLAIFVFIVGLFMTYGVYQAKTESELIKAQQEFKLQAQVRAQDVSSEFKRSYFQIGSIANLFISSDWVSNKEFKGYISSVFPEWPEGRRLSIINHVHEDEINAFINKAKTNPEPQYANYNVFDLKNKQISTPPVADEHYVNVVLYGHPRINQANFLGRNIRRDSPIGARFYRVVDTRSPLISYISPPNTGFHSAPFFLHLHPILKLSDAGERFLDGVVISSQYVENVFNNDFVQNTLDSFQYQLTDQSGNRYDYPQKRYYSREDIPELETQPFAISTNINVASDIWQLKIIPITDLHLASTALLQNLMIAGVALSFLLALLTWIVINQRGQLKRQVDLKTQQLNTAVTELQSQQLQLNDNNEQLLIAVADAEKSASIKSEFLANMSHEIRTPLNGIYGFSQLLLKTDLTLDQSKFLHQMETSVKHLMTVINDILDFSKIESGNITIEQAPFSVYKVIEFIHSSLDQMASEKGLQLEINILTEFHPDLLGDVVRINQILLNLCSNAIKFTEQGRVSVNVSMFQTKPDDIRSPIQVTFEVEDTGIGLKESQLAGLFSAFTQADASTTRKFGGTGLGLTISKKLCELMGGEIRVESEFGQGSHFSAIITLEQNTDIIQIDESNQKFSRELSILLVDDNPLALDILQLHLKDMNAKLCATTSCFEAINILTTTDMVFDLVLLDWNMHEMDGKKLVDSIIALNLPTLPKFIVISAYDISVIKHHAKPLPIAAILQKPCLQSKLFSTINDAVGNQAQTNDHKEVQSLDLAELKILVAEDNKINQLLINTMLVAEKVDVTMAEDGQICLDKLVDEGPFDVILMDINMPVLDGIGATRQIRKLSDKTLANIPIIALTANVMKEDVESYLDQGINAHVAKPVDFNKLRNVIFSLLKN